MGLVDSKRAQRLLETVLANRKNCRFEDLAALLEAVGFTQRAGKGSHVIFKRGAVTLTMPRRKPVKEVYVEYVLALIEAG